MNWAGIAVFLSSSKVAIFGLLFSSDFCVDASSGRSSSTNRTPSDELAPGLGASLPTDEIPRDGLFFSVTA